MFLGYKMCIFIKYTTVDVTVPLPFGLPSIFSTCIVVYIFILSVQLKMEMPSIVVLNNKCELILKLRDKRLATFWGSIKTKKKKTKTGQNGYT